MAIADNRSLGELMAELSRETGTLVRKEFELATTELTSRVRELAAHAPSPPSAPRCCTPACWSFSQRWSLG